jgi:hypothetical protein
MENKQDLEDFLLEHRDYFINEISENFQLDDYILQRFQEILNWTCLSENKNLEWSVRLISRFLKKWNWSNLSYNSKIYSNFEILKTYLNNLSPRLFRDFENKLPITDFYLEFKNPKEKESEKTFNDYVTRKIIQSQKPLKQDFLEKNKERLSWFALSYSNELPWSIELINRFKEKFHWPTLSNNPYLPLTEKLIDRFISRWMWYDYKVEKPNFFDYKPTGLQYNESFPWSDEMIEKYKDFLDWGDLSNSSKIIWSEEKIEKYQQYIVWWNFSLNENFKWTEDFINKYSEKLEWQYLRMNKAIPWNFKIIESNFVSISDSFITQDLYSNHEPTEFGIKKYYYEVVLKLKDFNFTIEEIDNNIKFISFRDLTNNLSFPWNKDLIKKYFNYIKKENCLNNLTNHTNIIWDNEMIMDYYDQINDFNQIIKNKKNNVEFTYELLIFFANEQEYWLEDIKNRKDINKYNIKWHFILSNYSWSLKELKTFHHLIDWDFIRRNVYVKWDIELISYCKPYFYMIKKFNHYKTYGHYDIDHSTQIEKYWTYGTFFPSDFFEENIKPQLDLEIIERTLLKIEEEKND